MNNITIWILQRLENVTIKHVQSSMSCFLGDTTETAGPEEKSMTEIPLLSNLSFLHCPFAGKRKASGRFKYWRLLFLSAILSGQQGCHIIHTIPEHERHFYAPSYLFMKWQHLCTIAICRTQTQKKQVSGTRYLYFFGTWQRPILTTLNFQAALLYQLVENRNNSASENLGLSEGTAHHWHGLSSTSTACQAWMTLHTLDVERRSPTQQPDYSQSFLHHTKLHSEQKASPFSLASFLTALHFHFSSQMGTHNDSTTCELLKTRPLEANDIMKTVYCKENVNKEQKVKDF